MAQVLEDVGLDLKVGEGEVPLTIRCELFQRLGGHRRLLPGGPVDVTYGCAAGMGESVAES